MDLWNVSNIILENDAPNGIILSIEGIYYNNLAKLRFGVD